MVISLALKVSKRLPVLLYSKKGLCIEQGLG